MAYAWPTHGPRVAYAWPMRGLCVADAWPTHGVHGYAVILAKARSSLTADLVILAPVILAGVSGVFPGRLYPRRPSWVWTVVAAR
eukprot:7114008-Lingulodinium_polyedra.AAC.1